MKITKRQLKRIIKETIEDIGRNQQQMVPMDEMINILLTHPDLNISFAKPGVEFDAANEGEIWMSGEDHRETFANGEQIFDDHSRDYDTYDVGVHMRFMEFLDQRGWFAEWYDAGTIFLHQDL